MRLEEFEELLDPDMEQENLRRAESLGPFDVYASHYLPYWSNWLPTEYLSIALDAYESEGAEGFAKFVGEALSQYLRPGDEVTTRRTIISASTNRTLIPASHGGTARGIVLSVSPEHVEVDFLLANYSTARRARRVGDIPPTAPHDILVWDVYKRAPHRLSLIDLAVDLEWDMGSVDWFYDYGLDEEQVVAAQYKRQEWIYEDFDFFTWFVKVHNAETAETEEGLEGVWAEYVVSPDTPETLIKIHDPDSSTPVTIRIGNLDEEMRYWYIGDEDE